MATETTYTKTGVDDAIAAEISAITPSSIGAEVAGAGATAEAFSIQRSNHTGTQTADTITDGTTNKAYTATEKTKLAAITGTNTGDQTTITGNAGTATKLATARNIDGQPFDGTVDVTTPNVKLSVTTTKGDLLIATGSGAVARHGVPADGKILIADSSQTDGWNSANRFVPQEFTFNSGDCFILAGQSSATTTVLTQNREIAIPFYVPTQITIAKLYCSVTTVGTSGAVVRLGIRAHDPATGLPKNAAPLVDAGTIDGTSATLQSITLGTPLTLAPGWYWYTITGQSGGTQATVQSASVTAIWCPIPIKSTTASSLTSNTVCGYYQSGVSAGLPSSWSTGGLTGTAPRMIAQIS